MSFLFDLDDKGEAVVRFISSVRAELVKAFVAHKNRTEGSLQSLADKIGGDKSAIHRQLNGDGNLTLRTVAELSWAMDMVPHFELKNSASAENINSDYAICLPKMASHNEILTFSLLDTAAANAWDSDNARLAMVA